MTQKELHSQILATWRLHNQILLFLLSEIPHKGFAAVPFGSKGRDISAQFAHLQSVRIGWLHYHQTGQRPKRNRYDKSNPPSRSQLKKDLSFSGRTIEHFLADALDSKVQPRMFGKQVIRWIGYLISHESHHRGQIMLALKQSDMKLPERVSMNGLWGKWIFGK